MIFEATPLIGAYLIRPEERRDDRGFFARMFCTREFGEHGLQTHFEQANISLSSFKGTVRGMHYQIAAAAEVKLIRCTAGALYDVALDLRPDSPTFGKWFGAELTAQNHTMLYVPRGCAHGFLSLTDNTEIFYLVSAPYTPQAERTVRYNDPKFGIIWPETAEHISTKDSAVPDFEPLANGIDALKGFA